MMLKRCGDDHRWGTLHLFKLIEKGLWEFDFAPHDAGQYPLANQQVYGYYSKYFVRNILPIEKQMPVEECGNMLLCVAALCYARKDFSYFKKHEKLLRQWADYLLKADYTKSDWQLWSTMLDEKDLEYFDLIVDRM